MKWYPIKYRKIEARPTRVSTVKRKTPCAERGGCRGAKLMSFDFVPGHRENIPMTVAKAEGCLYGSVYLSCIAAFAYMAFFVFAMHYLPRERE